MKFEIADIKPDFMLNKRVRSRVKLCDECSTQFKGDKFDEEQSYNKKLKIWVIRFKEEHEWKNGLCYNMDCENKITHGVYGIKLIAETIDNIEK